MFAPMFISPPFLRLWLGALISGLGDGLTWIALQWLMLEKTNDSGTAVGLMLLCFGLPAMLTGAPIGRLMDRFGAVPVMIVDNLARALLMAVIPFSALACVIAGLVALASPRMRNLEQGFFKENS